LGRRHNICGKDTWIDYRVGCSSRGNERQCDRGAASFNSLFMSFSAGGC
jgi:hypothetical protein